MRSRSSSISKKFIKRKRFRSSRSNSRRSRKRSYRPIKICRRRSISSRSSISSHNKYKSHNKNKKREPYRSYRSRSSSSRRSRDRSYKKRRNRRKSNSYYKKKKYYRDSRSRTISKDSIKSYSSSSSYHKKKNRSLTPSSSRSSGKSRRKYDEGHYKYVVNTTLHHRYKIVGFLGDGTFGRVLECKDLKSSKNYAVKIIRPVERYIDSAQIEVEILQNIMRNDYYFKSHCSKLFDHFTFSDKNHKYFALVFEKCGKSLYEFIKENKYRGFPITQVQSFAKQIIEGISFLHENLKLTHTDLKNVLHKERREGVSTCSNSREKDNKNYSNKCLYNIVRRDEIKIIDFGGATYEHEKHTDIINTRQYRAPEVILECQKWNEKSDLWSIACILAELYSGELLFPTHNDYEHLCLIERIAGPLPNLMVEKSENYKKIFELKRNLDDSYSYKININSLKKADEIEDALLKFDTFDELIIPEHKLFKDFLKFLLVIDPDYRPSCEKALSHPFFEKDFKYLV